MSKFLYRCRLTPTKNLSCKIKGIPGLTVTKERIKRDKLALEKWFYFYINDPINPVLLNFSKMTNYYAVLEPGSNRYIGVSLREKELEIGGLILTDTDNLKDLPYEIKIDGIGDRETLKEIYRIEFGICWVDEFDWVENNLKYTWGLEIDNEVFFLNHEYPINIQKKPPKEVKEIVRVRDHLDLESAIKYLFKRVVKTEFKPLA